MLAPGSRDLFSFTLKSIIQFIPNVHRQGWGFSIIVQWYLSTTSSTSEDNKGQVLEEELQG